MKKLLLIPLTMLLSTCAGGELEAYCDASAYPRDALTDVLLEYKPKPVVVIHSEHLIRVTDKACESYD